MQRADGKGRFPLHQILSKVEAYPFELVKLVVDLFPDAVKMKVANQECFPLHLACLSANVDVETVRLLIEHFPEALQSPGPSKRLPLHLACATDGIQPSVVQTLLSAYPEAVSKRDKTDSLPLHLACFLGSRLDVVKLLLESYPGAASTTRNKGKLPLHICCESPRASIEVVRELVQAYPEGIQARSDTSSSIPLHVACRSRAPVSVIEFLIKEYPKSLSIEDSEGNTALEIAMKDGSSRRTVALLQNALAGKDSD